MTLDQWFTVCNTAVLPFWLLLVVAPRARVTALLVHSPLVPALLGTAYGVFLATIERAPPGGSFFSLAGVTALFTLPQGVLVGWIHYLVFDLFIGAWQARDAARRGIPHALLIPCLLVTLMLGPLGLLLYLLLRASLKRRFSLQESD